VYDARIESIQTVSVGRLCTSDSIKLWSNRTVRLLGNRIESIRWVNRIKSIRIANRNAFPGLFFSGYICLWCPKRHKTVQTRAGTINNRLSARATRDVSRTTAAAAAASAAAATSPSPARTGRKERIASKIYWSNVRQCSLHCTHCDTSRTPTCHRIVFVCSFGRQDHNSQPGKKRQFGTKAASRRKFTLTELAKRGRTSQIRLMRQSSDSIHCWCIFHTIRCYYVGYGMNNLMLIHKSKTWIL